MAKIITNHCILIIDDEFVTKIGHGGIFRPPLSSISHEIEMLLKFRSRHKLEPTILGPQAYSMRRVSCSLGDHLGFRDEAFGIRDLDVQLDEILQDLQKSGIRHQDIHPGNLLWDGKTLILIDFYWANMDLPSDINQYYSQDDAQAIEMLKEEWRKGRKV